MRSRTLFLAFLLALGFGPAATAASNRGRVGGLVVAQGTPQLGAIVVVTPKLRPGNPLRLVTDSHGAFASSPLQPGFYSIRVRLAGFLPAFEPNVHVTGGRITLLRIELGSIFSSVEQLRHGPRPGNSPDEWRWVLRSASLTRPVLRFSDGHIVVDRQADRDARAAHGRAELTAGSLASWSPANTQPLGTTSFLYDQGLGGANRLLLAGRVGYQHTASSGFAATWIRSAPAKGEATDSTTVIFRQSQMGIGGPSFRGLEIDSVRHMKVGEKVEIEYGGQYVFAMLNGSVSGLRPEAKARVALTPGWTASFLLGSNPRRHRADSPVDSLDSLPTPVESQGHLALDRDWHEEISLQRSLGPDAKLTAAIFHDSDAHTAIFGRGPLQNYNTISDPYSDAFVYNGGALAQWGERIGYQRKLSSNWQTALVYGSVSALAPAAGGLTAASLRSMISRQRRDLVAGRIAGRIERTGTEVTAGYEWIDGPVLNRPDPFGSSMFGVQPYLNVSVRQPLPSLFCCRIVALIDVQNLLAQGYVSLETADGRAILIPTARAFRGGFAVQF
jgi:hypothetical protein